MDSININERLIGILKSRNIVPAAILDNILSNLRGKDIQEILLEEGLISKEKLVDLLSEILGWKVLVGKEFKPNEEAAKSIPPFLTKFHNFIPLGIEEKTIKVGFFPPVKPTAIEDIRLLTGYDVEPYLLKISSGEEDLSSLIAAPKTTNVDIDLEPKKVEEPLKGIEIGTWDESELNKIIEELTPEGGILEESSSASLLIDNQESQTISPGENVRS